MELETFFEKFEVIAEAPGAVEKLREVVLELGVTGMLQTQDPDDADASEILAAAKERRKLLVSKKTIKARKIRQVSADEQAFALPTGWAWARLAEVGHELGQKVPDRLFTYIDVGGIDADSGTISDRLKPLEADAAPSRARKLVRRGTVIYSTVRPYLRNIAIVETDYDPEPIASTAFGILHPFEGVNARFLFLWLRSKTFTAYVESAMKGLAYPAINDAKFYSGCIALPPLAEQKRIVAKVDSLMALCDQLEAQQQERQTRQAALTRASLARFAEMPTVDSLNLLFRSDSAVPPEGLRNAARALALRGKLVERHAGDGDVEADLKQVGQLLAKMVSEKAIPKLKKLAAPRNAPFPLPASWQWVQLGKIAQLIEYGTSQKACLDSNLVPVHRMGDIQNGSVLNNNLKYVSPDVDDLPRLYLEPGDVLFNRTNSFELVGKAGLFDGASGTATFASYLIRVRVPAALIDPAYINLCFSAPYYRATQINPEITQQCGQANFNGTKLAHTLFPLPPLPEQRRIVARVDRLMARVDELEARLASARDTARDLLDALVADLTTPRP